MSSGQLSLTDTYRQAANTEPLPGYRLLDPLGRGGFGEVWRCEAPGGLHKAVKFVYPDPDAEDGPGDSLRQEYEAFQHIKTIRHPFLLMLERVELVGGVLVSVMELADAGLGDRFAECVVAGLPGVPRAELLGYLTDAAEALDVIAVKHGLQHLDIKPANLFLVGGHVKVGDYGLVSRSQTGGRDAGFTPKYAPPELLDGVVDPRSDQYSLALVYFEMLTGGFPFKGTAAKALMMAHAAAAPDLAALPAGDRPVVARALAKKPADRFPNCLGFVRALLSAGPPPPSDVTLRQARMAGGLRPAGPPGGSSVPDVVITRSRMPAAGSPTPSAAPLLRTPGQSGIVTGVVIPKPHTPTPAVPPPAGRPADPGPPSVVPLVPDPGPASVVPLVLDAGPPSVVPAAAGRPTHRLTTEFRAVLPVPVLTGGVWLGAAPPAGAGFAAALFAAAHGGGPLPAAASDPVRQPDGSWACRFPAKLMAPTVRLKLQAIQDQWGGELLQPEPCRFALRLHVGKGRSWLGRGEPAGLTVDLELPPPAAAHGDVRVTGRLFGPLDPAGHKRAADALPQILSALRSQLQNLPDRRKAPRVAYTGPLVLYPVDAEGAVFAPVAARGVDVSPTGLCCRPARPVISRFVYAEFPRVPGLAQLAVLAELLVKRRAADDAQVAGVFRLDLDKAAGEAAASTTVRY